jgi:putative cardiolipin synthase
MFTGLMRALACGVLVMSAGCASLPANVERKPSSVLTDTADTRLARTLAPAVAANPGKTAVHALPGGREAFAARMALAAVAERSIDAQYYIWHDDITGSMLMQAMLAAADRGVRVRLLIDDNNTKGMDVALALLDAHANIEVRLFNPFANRTNRLAGYASDFSRLNRRMHNKSFTADNQVTIVGGRNIGDEYFGAADEMEFADLDVMAAARWCTSVDAVRCLLEQRIGVSGDQHRRPSTPDAQAQVLARWADLHQEPRAGIYVDAVRATPLMHQLLTGTLSVQWVPAHLIFDDPTKVLHPPERTDLHMLPRLEAALGKPMSELDVVSPYFVPTEDGTRAFRAMADRGVQVRVLTNSLSATDVGPVYAGYSKYREALLRGGNLRLFEFKRSAAVEGSEVADKKRRGIGSSSDSGLHAKTFAADRQRIFIGSFNLDPRSARLNTEMGVVLDSAPLASHLSDLFANEFPATSTRCAWHPTARVSSGSSKPHGPGDLDRRPRRA